MPVIPSLSEPVRSVSTVNVAVPCPPENFAEWVL